MGELAGEGSLALVVGVGDRRHKHLNYLVSVLLSTHIEGLIFSRVQDIFLRFESYLLTFINSWDVKINCHLSRQYLPGKCRVFSIIGQMSIFLSDGHFIAVLEEEHFKIWNLFSIILKEDSHFVTNPSCANLTIIFHLNNTFYTSLTWKIGLDLNCTTVESSLSKSQLPISKHLGVVVFEKTWMNTITHLHNAFVQGCLWKQPRYTGSVKFLCVYEEEKTEYTVNCF